MNVRDIVSFKSGLYFLRYKLFKEKGYKELGGWLFTYIILAAIKVAFLLYNASLYWRYDMQTLIGEWNITRNELNYLMISDYIYIVITVVIIILVLRKYLYLPQIIIVLGCLSIMENIYYFVIFEGNNLLEISIITLIFFLFVKFLWLLYFTRSRRVKVYFCR